MIGHLLRYLTHYPSHQASCKSPSHIIQHTSVHLQVQIMSDHALLHYNKVWAKVRTLQSLNQSRHRLCHEAARVQASMQDFMSPDSKQRRLTVYEAALLRDPEKMQQHQQSLEAAAGVTAECKQAMRSAQTFFSWVASLHDTWLQAGYLHPVSQSVIFAINMHKRH